MKSCEDGSGGGYIPPLPNDGILYSEFLSRKELEEFFNDTLLFILKLSGRAYGEENIKNYLEILERLYDNFEIAGKDGKKEILKYNESRDIIFLIESISSLIEQKRVEFPSSEKNKLFNSIPSMLMNMLRESVGIQQFEILKKDCLTCSQVGNKNKAKVFEIIKDYLKNIRFNLSYINLRDFFGDVFLKK